MLRIIKTTITFLLLVFIASSCKKDRATYKGEPGRESGVYFYSVATFTPDGTPLSYRDSIVFSFLNVRPELTEVKVDVPVKVIGTVTDYDRYFKIKASGGTAIEGVDYKKLDDQYMVPAGQASVNLPVILLRNDRLTTESYYIDLQLVESEDFKLILPFLINIGNNEKMDATRFRVRFSEIITIPSYWVSWGGSYFGDWSIKKFQILNSLMDWTPRDWNYAGRNGFPVQLGKFPYAATIFREYLQNAADKGDIIYDEDGVTPMQLAPSYLVNY